MRKNFVILILTLAMGLFLSINIVNGSRPFSVPCEFESEIVDFKVTIHPENNIEEVELTLKVTSYEPPAPGGYWYDTDKEMLKQMCTFPSPKIITGRWFTPGQPYTKDQPYVDKNKVLVKGSIIKGNIDSYDKIIKNVSLAKEAVKKDITDTTNKIRDDNAVDKDTNNFILYISILVLILAVVIVFFITKYRHK